MNASILLEQKSWLPITLLAASLGVVDSAAGSKPEGFRAAVATGIGSFDGFSPTDPF